MKKTLLILFVILVVGLKYSYCQEDSAKAKGSQTWLVEKPTGLYNVTTFSVASFYGTYMNGMQTIFGYKINSHFAIGGGVGLERFKEMPMYQGLVANLSLLPVFADIRYTVINKNVTPVIALNGGYKVLLNIPSTQMSYSSIATFPGISWSDYYEYDTYTRGGLFFGIETGVRIRLYNRFALYGSLNYMAWSVSGDHHYWRYDYLNGSSGLKVTEFHSTTSTLAYTHAFQVRVGFCF